MANVIEINPPHVSEEKIRSLKKGDIVSITGTIITGRDVAHKYLEDNFISPDSPVAEEVKTLEELKKVTEGGIIYHCGPVVAEENGEYKFLAAGPTTSIREEPYEYDVMKLLGLRGVIGKGGMGPKTLKACVDLGGVYLHAIGGAATLIAQNVKKVKGVIKEEFGTPEAFWIIEVENFETIVTMDSHGESLHDVIQKSSEEKLASIFETL